MQPRRQVRFFHDAAQFMVMMKDVKDYCQFIGYWEDPQIYSVLFWIWYFQILVHCI